MRACIPFSLLLIAAAVSPIDISAQIRSFDYDTPAYIDFEFSEIIAYEDQAVVVINLYRSGDFRQVTRVQFATEELTSTEGQDYKGTGGTITFRPGEGMKQVEIPLIADSKTEQEESFKLVLSEPSANALLLRNSTTIKIRDVTGAISLPKLEVASIGEGKIALSWDGESSYLLERTATTGFLHWETFPCTPAVNGTRCEVTTDADGAVYFYRLRVR